MKKKAQNETKSCKKLKRCCHKKYPGNKIETIVKIATQKEKVKKSDSHENYPGNKIETIVKNRNTKKES